MNRELREWLGLTWADLLVYVSCVPVVLMFLVKDRLIDIVLAGAGLLIALVACPLGMKRDPKLSTFTNIVKILAYPGVVLLLAAAIAAHFLWFTR